MTQQLEQNKDHEGLQPTRVSAWRVKSAALVAAGVVAAVLAACGNTAATTPRDSTSSSRPTDVPAPKQWVIKAGDLPAGWHNSNPPSGDFRLTFCGVDTEPVLAVRAGVWRWSQGGLGPFLEQHVRVYRDDQAEAIISALRAALPTCTKTEVPRDDTDNTKKATLKVEPITVAGAGLDSVAWRQTTVSATPVTAEIVFTRRGRTLVVFTSYSFATKLDRNVLVRAVAALQAKPKS